MLKAIISALSGSGVYGQNHKFTQLCEAIKKRFVDEVNVYRDHGIVEDEIPKLANIVQSFLDKAHIHSSESAEDSKLIAFRILADECLNFSVLIYLLEKNYAAPLLRNHERLIFRDEYGDTKVDGWLDEVESFFNNHDFDLALSIEEILGELILNVANGDPLNSITLSFSPNQDERMDTFHFTIGAAIDLYEEHFSVENSVDYNITNPYEYEQLVAEEIRSYGWDAHATQGSGDQGADVIARLGSLTVVIQAKLYSSPVGNKSVQEVAAAKGYYDADHAIVVSNNSFTKSAMLLAESLEVILIHHSQLHEIFQTEQDDDDEMEDMSLGN